MEELDASATIEDEEAAIAADEDEACQEMFSTYTNEKEYDKKIKNKRDKTCNMDDEDAASVPEDPSINVNCFALKLFASTSWKRRRIRNSSHLLR